MKTFHFDWDDNVMYMPTNIIIFNKETKNPIFLSTEVFAHLREKVGTDCKFDINQSIAIVNYEGSENLLDYEFIYSDDMSFREFRDTPQENKFLRDLKLAVLENKFAPSWTDFQEALSDENTAKYTSIVTARGNNPESILEGMKHLQSLGLIKHLPVLEHIFPVSWDGFKSSGTADKPQDKKLEVLSSLIKKIESINPKASFGFSDDDSKTIAVLKDYLLNHKTTLKLYLYHTKIKKDKVL